MFSDSEIKLALKYVAQDVSDDFWSDVINYSDLLGNTDWCKEIDFASYKPSETFYVDVPKPTMILRPGHYIELADRVYYQLLVNKFAKETDAKFTSEDVNCGYRLHSKQSRFFRDGIEAWKKFRNQDSLHFQSKNKGLLLKTDISAYFEHIKVERLINSLSNLGADGKILRKLEDLLNFWAEDGIGIPQGNGSSSFLANAYLDEIDKAMISEGYNYYRFVDDISIFADDELIIRKAIQRMTQLFRPLNLHLNSGKTKIFDFDAHTKSLNEHQDLMESVNYVLFFEDFPDTHIVDESLQAIWKDTVTEKSIDKTKFRYCVARFRKIKSEFPLKDILKKELFDPSNIDLVSNYLEGYINEDRVQKVVLNNFIKSDYDYELIYLLKLLLKSDELKFDLSEISKSKVYSTANFLLIGYYLMVVAKFGSQGDRTLITADFNKQFRTNRNISRYYMLATQYFPNPETEYTKLLEKHAYLKPTAVYLAKT